MSGFRDIDIVRCVAQAAAFAPACDMDVMEVVT